MPEQEYNCGKCGANMRRGFIAERNNHDYYVTNWYEGEPTGKTLLGIELPTVDTANRGSFGIRSLRCDRCGFLELYAV
ncbi:MAG: hypothetical protein AB7F88_10890 [Pyrinomonadaceae bacterium]